MINDGDYPAEKHQCQGRGVIKLRTKFFNGENSGRPVMTHVSEVTRIK
jgi:hypothetical protein